MFPINLPAFDIKTQTDGRRTRVYDPLRRRFVVLTPEEWVRQHFVHFLIAHRGYPQALLGNEISLKVGGATRRCDTVLVSPADGSPRVIVEYKAPTVPITQAVFNQIGAYNSVLHAPYLFVSNGLRHFCARIDYERHAYAFLPDVPRYGDL